MTRINREMVQIFFATSANENYSATKQPHKIIANNPMKLTITPLLVIARRN
ncbi:hypothetical protein LINGRAHAP2_LOCUS33942 [Linum grandiflorum]